MSTSVPRRRRTVAAAVLAAVLLLAPVALAQPADELEATRQERDAAEAARVEAEQRLAQVAAEVAAGEAELDRLSAELAAVEARLGPAREQLVAAERRRGEARERLGAAQGRLDEVRAALAVQKDRLAAHAVSLYQQGAGGRTTGMLDTLLGQGEGNLAERLPYLQALVENDLVLLESAEALTTAERAATDEVERFAAGAQAEQRAAAAALTEAERLLRDQTDLLAASRVAQDQRLALLDRLQADVEARAELVRQLDAQVALLERSRVGEPPTGAIPDWAGRLPAGGPEWAPAIESAGRAERVDPRLLAALVWTESTFRPTVVSPAGAVGLCQLLPSTARGLGVDPFVPEQNLVGGARYLRQLLDRYPNRADLALAAYNAGFGNVDRAGPGVPDIPETQLYVQRVLDRFDILAAP